MMSCLSSSCFSQDSIVVRDEPIFTDIYPLAADFCPERKSAYLYGRSVEERSTHVDAWQGRAVGVRFARVIDETDSEFTIEHENRQRVVSLRSRRQLANITRDVTEARLYLDITGLSHHVWAPLLRAALENCADVKGVYVEPGDYRFSAAPTEGEIFDLSERIRGIRPIPGFACLDEPDRENVCFVPLLGFEGTRFAHALEQVQPAGQRILPVIGVPGFRPEYPFYTYHGNRSALIATKCWKNVRFAVANCPFSLFYLLKRIRGEYAGTRLVIAPIGTKPHGLGAVLYYLASPDRVEIVYDHPIRKAARTAGSSRLLVYHLSTFASKPR